ncbi:MAG: hypothetical protein QOI31_723 [Solirubrobacterales bacterium]|jgi:hypothetical protein|nr:hypothetical protein [Solirubrobacterales bacterium]
MRRIAAPLLAVGAALALAGPATAAPLPAEPTVTAKTDILFIGFEEGDGAEQISLPEFRAYLPDTNEQVIRSEFDPDVGGPPPTGLTLEYQYKTAFAPANLEDRFFAYLERIGQPTPPTGDQLLYNNQAANELEIDDEILRIDGAKVEKWLLENLGSAPGLGNGKNALVFINWHGRPDFRFHVFLPNGRDPDTGRDDRLIDPALGSEWGGTHGRLWFYDVSAGPDSTNWNLDDEEFFRRIASSLGDGFADIRIPPVWEMGGGLPDYIVPDATTATYLLARFSLFVHHHSSPIYDPMTSLPDPGGKRIARMNLFQEDPLLPMSVYLDPDLALEGIQALQPYIPLESSLIVRPLEGDDLEAYEIMSRSFGQVDMPDGCWKRYDSFYSQFYCYVAENLDEFAEAGPADWALPMLLYEVSDETSDTRGRFHPLGVATSAPNDKPYTVFAQTIEGARAFAYGATPGIGMTDVAEHEVGHHVGLSHEHDGWDGETNSPFGAYAATWMWALDGCQCTMGYLNSSDFGQFEMDAVDRALAARTYTTAFALLPELSGATRAKVKGKLADTLDALRAEDYRQAVKRGISAYYAAFKGTSPRKVRAAADTGGATEGEWTIHPGAIDPTHDSPALEDPEPQGRWGVKLP